jgi:hypothetical protein
VKSPSSERRWRLLASILVVLVTAALAVAGCGGSDGSGEDVGKVLNETFGGDKKVRSGELSMNLTAELEGLPQANDPITVKVGGPFQNQGENKVPKLDLDLSAGAGGQTFRAGVVSTGQKGFINFQGIDYVVPDELFDQFQTELRRQRRDQQTTPDLGALGVKPREWLRNPKDEGTEDIGGDETIHISSDVDVARMLEDLDGLLGRTGDLGLSAQQRRQLPRSIPDNVKKQIEDSVTQASIDVYTGKDDKILRKLEVKLDFDVAEQLRDDTAGVKSGKVEFTVEIAELNEPQEITAPSDARPLKELQDQLGSLGGGTGGLLQPGGSGGGSSGGSGGGSGGGSSGGSGAGSGSGSGGGDLGSGTGGNQDFNSAQGRRYLRCLEDAKGTEDLRACAKLLD